MRRGDPLPPIEVYRIGDAHFVRDGHHRVSVARALGYQADRSARHRGHHTRRRVARPHDRRPPAQEPRARLSRARAAAARRRRRIKPSDTCGYGHLAEAMEAWAFRAGQERGELLDREQAAREWFDTEYEPVVEALREADVLGDGTETDAYLRVGPERYRLVVSPSRRGADRLPAGSSRPARRSRSAAPAPPRSPRCLPRRRHPTGRDCARSERRTGGSSPGAARAGGSAPPSPSSPARGARPHGLRPRTARRRRRCRRPARRAPRSARRPRRC